jgi:hypothetical protein
MNLHEMWRNLVEKPRLVKLLVIFYGLQGIYLLSIVSIFVFSLFVYLVARGHIPAMIQGGGPFMIAIILTNGISLIGALLYLSTAWGILAAKGWARILGIIVSILVLPYLILVTISSVESFLRTFQYTSARESSLMFLVFCGIPTILNIASIYLLLRPTEVKAYFRKKRTSE